jgi:CRP-like cAMP-binding protein
MVGRPLVLGSCFQAPVVGRPSALPPANRERSLPLSSNLLLRALPDAEREALAPHLTAVAVKQHDLLYDVREDLDEVYFATSAVISLVVPLSTGEVVESAMVGRDGIVGAGSALNGRVSLNRAMVQIGGGCLVCPVEPLKEALENHPNLRSLLGAHEQALFAQAQQSAACNATHVIESRLSRWLLRAADLHGSDELPLTQEYIAQMLGVRRTSVTVVARTLQDAGLIRYKRGNLKLLDIPGLQDTACECYRAVKLNYDGLIHPSIK